MSVKQTRQADSQHRVQDVSGVRPTEIGGIATAPNASQSGESMLSSEPTTIGNALARDLAAIIERTERLCRDAVIKPRKRQRAQPRRARRNDFGAVLGLAERRRVAAYVDAMAPDFVWEPPSPELVQVQRDVLRRLEEFETLLGFVLRDAPTRDRERGVKACAGLRSIVEREWPGWGVPESAEHALRYAEPHSEQLQSLLDPLQAVTRVVAVPDTSFLLDYGSEPDKWTVSSLPSAFTMLLVAQVVREMDEHKRGRDELRDRARAFNKQVGEWQRRATATGRRGVENVKVAGEVHISVDPVDPRGADYPDPLSPEVPDDRVLAGVLNYARRNPTHAVLFLATDRNISLKAQSLGLAVAGT